MTTPRWTAAGLDATPTDEWDPASQIVIRPAARAATLGPELARSLAWWLLAHVGDRQAAPDPDRVRLAVDAARTALRQRSALAGMTEDFRAGLAWCDHHLDHIARAAS
ncbi:MAG: hypothetical protein L0H84_21715 [Pseudonocardia sp.]|nr:hypothetical protein [Pseudonocardia sp.]